MEISGNDGFNLSGDYNKAIDIGLDYGKGIDSSGRKIKMIKGKTLNRKMENTGNPVRSRTTWMGDDKCYMRVATVEAALQRHVKENKDTNIEQAKAALEKIRQDHKKMQILPNSTKALKTAMKTLKMKIKNDIKTAKQQVKETFGNFAKELSKIENILKNCSSYVKNTVMQTISECKSSVTKDEITKMLTDKLNKGKQALLNTNTIEKIADIVAELTEGSVGNADEGLHQKNIKEFTTTKKQK